MEPICKQMHVTVQGSSHTGRVGGGQPNHHSSFLTTTQATFTTTHIVNNNTKSLLFMEFDCYLAKCNHHSDHLGQNPAWIIALLGHPMFLRTLHTLYSTKAFETEKVDQLHAHIHSRETFVNTNVYVCIVVCTYVVRVYPGHN